MVPINLLLRVLLLCAVMWWLTAPQDPDQREMELLQKQIEGWRKAAEFCGRRVIKLEVRHAELAETNRTI